MASLRESIANVVKTGGRISVAYKTKINEWYGDLTLYHSDYRKKYVVEHYQEFENIDAAVDLFMQKAYTSANVGYIQNRLKKKGIDFEADYDLEKPSKALKKLFADEGKLVDSEFNSL